MLGYQLTRCILYIQQRSSHPYRFLGLFDVESDTEKLEAIIPSRAEDGSWCLVLHADSAHWTLLCFDARQELVIFGDSLGRDLAQYNFALSSHLQSTFGAGSIVHLPGYPIQGVDSKTCGIYVVYWVFQLSRGVPLTTLCRDFPPNNAHRNDSKVIQWFRRHFPHLFLLTTWN